MAKQWIEFDEYSIHSYSRLGTQDHTITRCFDGWDYWWPNAVETHWFVIDMGAVYTIDAIRGRSNYPGWNPTDIDVYVSENAVSWGSAVCSNINDWKDTDVYREWPMIEKNGRYVRLLIRKTEQGDPGDLAFGKYPSSFKIVEIYGELTPTDYPVDRLKKNVIHGYNCFVGAYVAAKIGGFTPLKLPDGTTF